ncbi:MULTISPECIES: glycoside hydrolase family 2 protein [Cryobacterium]|uniref:glycoside hydrolase family 2 protein n=1 Tax=Cryobacterium TaxID=69578 RepID=UPI000CD417DB|nr:MULTISPECIES: glycoside hydrolase family 2 TIM barrel-domain containing protein [Cryobacterium]POH67814.1 glycoside hydrolase family 2 [Cryobacterium zongtaii]TFC47814.1 glycoside hydrolase family 2 [Cryobacterium sp. TMN-39-2]
MTLLTNTTPGHTTVPSFIDSARAAVPRSEYPRPDLDRSARWLCLNGEWDFTSIDGKATITVPFAWETTDSGIGRTWLESATYRRRITAPQDWDGSRIILCFGAVWHRATISIDGDLVGEHVGGYTSFEFDVTDHLHAGRSAELVVDVSAPADKRALVHGKQRSIPRDDYDGVSFTPTSGIWQSVWLEGRGRTYAHSVQLRGDSRTGIDVSVQVLGDVIAGSRITARVVDGRQYEAVELTTDSDGRASGRIEMAEPRIWTPTDPHLYRVEITTAEGREADLVIASTGLRSIEVRGEELYLNDERLYVRGVLDQGYWPTSGLTAPDDESLRHDLTLARELGFNLVRKHLKFEEPRWLHAADEMGMLVWAEPACPSRHSDEAAAAFDAQIGPMVERDGNHPSIVIWGLYNEEWGLDWDIPGSSSRAAAAVAAYDILAAIDRTRPIVENSGWSHVRSDLVDWHYYEPDPETWAQSIADLASGKRHDFPVKLGPDFVVDKSLYGTAEFPRTGVPILNSEFGEGFTSLERAWHVRWQTQELRRHDRFAGYVYTELTDVEHECAGLVDGDRRQKDWGGLDPADSNANTVLIVDLVPERAGADIPVPTGITSIGVRVSHHAVTSVTAQLHAVWVAAGVPFRAVTRSPDSAPSLPGSVSSAHVVVNPFVVTEAVQIVVAPPEGPARLLLWLTDNSGRVIARTFIDAAEIEPPNRRGARPGQAS